MKVDLETLSYLEIVPGPSAPASVIDCLDRTGEPVEVARRSASHSSLETSG